MRANRKEAKRRAKVFGSRGLYYFLSFVLFLLVSACTLSGGPIDGVVVEEGGKPISGAIIVARWTGSNVSGLVHSQSTCYHIETTISDTQGQYHIPRWSNGWSIRALFMEEREVSVVAYKAGYVWVLRDPPQVSRQFLTPFTGQAAERLKYLSRFSGMQCGERENYAKQLVPFYTQIYEEAKSIAITNEEKRSASNRLRDLEEMEVGHDKAWKNWRAREKALE